SSAAANGGSGGRAAGGAGGTTAASGSGGSGGAGGATATRTLTDAQIAAVTTVANSGEVDLGTLAVARAVLPAVRDFAQMMVTMHTAAQTRQSAVLATLGVQIAPNPISTQLEADAMALRGQLTSASAAAFDRAYIQSQVDVHMRVLTTFDEQLLPNATAPALRADLMLARGEVAAHLALARTLLATLDDLSDAGVP
ncbi:MAG TPA: DUF4142 domain-containing protein, partial [Polyangiales bacterium]|nr:DUF4142 domain-containing protein [Polyangiales bacterium]